MSNLVHATARAVLLSSQTYHGMVFRVICSGALGFARLEIPSNEVDTSG